VEDSETLDPDRVYRLHVQQVGRWVARLGGPALDLKDTVHEVFAIAFSRLAHFRGDSSVATWLFGITDMVVRHRRRKDRWWRWLTVSVDKLAGRLPAKGLDPLKSAEQNQTSAHVYRVLDQLAEGDRRILILFELEELSASEVGELLAIKPANARLRLHRARSRFLAVYQREFKDDLGLGDLAEVSSKRCENANR
jgi:RNA polymerase sigma-70 factor (ECF subfamily)